jgi:archaemetzincin
MNSNSARSLPALGLVEMGRLGEVAVHVVAAHLQAFLGIPVDRLDPLDIPQQAFQEHRKQYDAGLMLKYLAELPLPPYLRILGLTTVDLCIPILTYVYGEAEVGGKTAVVSSFRLRHNDDGTVVSPDRYYERLAKVALHEAAHTFSVFHCDNAQCLMRFSPKSSHLDQIEIVFCERCEFTLRENLKHVRL